MVCLYQQYMAYIYRWDFPHRVIVHETPGFYALQNCMSSQKHNLLQVL